MVQSGNETNDSVLPNTTSSKCKIIKKFGRVYCVPSEDENDQVLYVYLTSQYSRKNFENFLLSLPGLISYVDYFKEK